MAADDALFSRVKWNRSPVTFHTNKGKCARLTEDNKVATRVTNHGHAIVLTSEPLRVGQLFKVTVTKMSEYWTFDGLDIGFTGENPANSTITEVGSLDWRNQDRDMVYTSIGGIYYNEKVLCQLGFSTRNLQAGQSLGLLLTSEGECHWFLDGEWRGSVPVSGFPLDQPMWGVVDVFAQCEQVRADIFTVSKYPPASERRLVEMGLIQKQTVLEPRRLLQEMLGISSDSTLELIRVREQLDRLQSHCHQLQQELRQIREHTAAETQQLTQQLHGADAENQLLTQRLQDRDAEIQLLTQTNQQVTQSKQQLTQSNRQLQRTNAENQQLVTMLQRTNAKNQQLVTTLRDQIDVLQRRVSSAPSNAQEVEFWQVSPDEVSVREDHILGRGAWGYVAKGIFRGTKVAVKRVYPEILQQTTIERIRREIRTMAQIRHPNLVLFIAAVLNEQTGPMIVTELLDISLRGAYQTNHVGPNKRRIFEDVASALLYLHRQREPIIHRDVSSANVLLSALPNDTWLAKLSDFGSANLVRDATTPGEGAILYTAPEAFPQGPYSVSPQPQPRQTTKIDVYSFGVLACEVATQTFPKAEVFHELLSRVSRMWDELHPLIVSCVSHSPQDRPSMDIVLQQLKRLDSEP